jgi:hypothetical protein
MSSDSTAASERKIEANRLNAQKSTGPRTSDGKRAASRNAIQHGIFSRQLLLPGEDAAAFEELRRDLLRRLNPRDVLELKLVEKIIAAQWKLQRLEAVERRVLGTCAKDLDERRRGAALRDSIVVSGDVGKARLNLQANDTPENRRKFEQLEATYKRLKHEYERVPEIPVDRLLEGALNNPAMEKLHRLMQRMENSFHRCLRQLRELQKQPPAEPNEFTAGLLDEPGTESDEAAVKSDKTNPPPAEPPATPEVAGNTQEPTEAQDDATEDVAEAEPSDTEPVEPDDADEAPPEDRDDRRAA